MFSNKTVVVIGAGASKEANLPTAAELKAQIARLLDIRFEDFQRHSGSSIVLNALKLEVGEQGDINSHLDAARLIRDAMPLAISIDDFLESHSGNKKIELCGKLAIVQSVLDAERSSLLYVDTMQPRERLNHKSLGSTWFNSFVQLLTESCHVEQLPERLASLALIVFNYDRCVEHFLYHSLQTYYGINAQQAVALIKHIEIYHPYGLVGHLPWQQTEGSVDFGAMPRAQQLLALAAQIKTFTESADPGRSDIIAIRERVRDARILVFLGFAFHRLNLTLLKSSDSANDGSPVRVFATAKGISHSDCKVVTSELIKLIAVNEDTLHLRWDTSCSELFHEYKRSLSLTGRDIPVVA